MLNLAVVVLCYDDNQERTFEEKRQQLMQADLPGFTKCQEALAHILSIYQAATNAYGSEFMTMYEQYDLLQLVKSKLGENIRFEMEDIIARESKDLRNMIWRKIEDLISDAWGTAARRPQGYYARVLGSNKQTVRNPPAAVNHPAAGATPTMHATRIHPGSSQPATTSQTQRRLHRQDPAVSQCQRYNDDGTKCNANFIWSASEQLLHKHTSFFIIEELTSLCYGLGSDLVHQDFPFQSIREKSFKREIKGMANS